MSEWSLEFELSPVRAAVVPILLLLLLLGARRFAAYCGIASLRAWFVAALAAVVGGGLIAASDRSRDRWWIALIAATLLVEIWRRYAAPTGAVRRAERILLSLLRTTAVLALLVLLVRPVFMLHQLNYTRPAVGVLIDQSRSMRTRDVIARGGSQLMRRSDALAAAFAGVARQRARLSQDCDVTLWGFDATLHPLADWTAGADGEATAIAAALDGVAQRAADAPAAVLLISDGRETAAPREQAIAAGARWATRGVPIVTVGVGAGEPLGDVGRLDLANVAAPRDALLGGAFAIDAELAALGLRGGEIEIECRDDDELAATRIIRPDKASFVERLHFALVGRRSGFHRIEIRARVIGSSPPLLAAESRVVHVHDDRLRVLLVEAHPRTESAFIARALAGDSRIAVTTTLVAPPAEGAWSNPLPRSVEAWRAQDVVVLGDLRRGEIVRSSLDSLAEAVTRRGVGLIALGGARQLDLLRGAPLADLAPTHLDAARAALHDVRPTPSAAGRRHALCQVGPPGADPAEVWRSLPPSVTACSLGTCKPAAEALLVSDGAASLLAVMTAGRGRVAAIGLESTWRWPMLRDDGRALHARFWRQLVLWAAWRQPTAVIATDRARYALAALRSGLTVVQVEARLSDPRTGAAPDAARIEVVLREATSSRPASRAAPASGPADMPLLLTREGDRWVGTCAPKHAGEYVLELSARLDEPASAASGSAPFAEPMRATTQFSIVEIDPELERPETDFGLLVAISAATASVGGRFYSLDRLGEGLDLLGHSLHRRPVQTSKRIDMISVHGGVLLAVICVALILEWSLRRRRGFV